MKFTILFLILSGPACVLDPQNANVLINISMSGCVSQTLLFESETQLGTALDLFQLNNKPVTGVVINTTTGERRLVTMSFVREETVIGPEVEVPSPGAIRGNAENDE